LTPLRSSFAPLSTPLRACCAPFHGAHAGIGAHGLWSLSRGLLFRLFQAVSNQGETDRPLVLLVKMAPVSPFHGFEGEAPGNFEWPQTPRISNSAASLPKMLKKRNSRNFYPYYQ